MFNKKNNSFKKILFLLTLLLSLSFVLPALALSPGSDTVLKNAGGKAGYNVAGTSDTTVSQYVGVYIKMILSLVGTIFLVLTIYAGILWMTASGNDEQITKATNILKAAVIGFVIITSAYSLTAFVVAGGAPTASNTSSGGCELGDWDRDASYVRPGSTSAGTDASYSQALNQGTYDAVCGLKGLSEGITGGAGALIDIFTLGSTNFGSEWSSY
ncbi:MAG: pilin [Candidatus Omnitrophota bacterium]